MFVLGGCPVPMERSALIDLAVCSSASLMIPLIAYRYHPVLRPMDTTRYPRNPDQCRNLSNRIACETTAGGICGMKESAWPIPISNSLLTWIPCR